MTYASREALDNLLMCSLSGALASCSSSDSGLIEILNFCLQDRPFFIEYTNWIYITLQAHTVPGCKL
jgi:hypothetical protein